MRYLSVLLAFSLMLGVSCKNETGGDKEDTAPATAEVDSSSMALKQNEAPRPAPEAGAHQSYDIEGKQWVLSKYTYEERPERPVGDNPIYLRIQGNQLTGNGGCNDINGQIVLGEDGAVYISGIASTRKLCRGVMTQETRIIQLLKGARTFKVNLVFLELAGPEGKLTFRNDL